MITTDKLILTVAPCGSFMMKDANPNMPIQPEEIAEEVCRAWNEGAAIVHIHARDKEGKATTDPKVFQEIGRLIREKGSDIIIQHSTSPGRELDASVKDGIHAVTAGPEMISIDTAVLVATRGAEETVTLWTRSVTKDLAGAAQGRGIKVELETFGVGGFVEADYLIGEGLFDKPYWFNFALDMHRTVQNVTPYSVKNLLHLVEHLPQEAMFTTMGIGATEIQAVTASMLLGGHARVGFEDNLYYSRGVLAKSNAELVERVAKIGRELGRTIATPNEARKLLGIPLLAC